MNQDELDFLRELGFRITERRVARDLTQAGLADLFSRRPAWAGE